jgi:hypothetical protein
MYGGGVGGRSRKTIGGGVGGRASYCRMTTGGSGGNCERTSLTMSG